MLDNIFYFITVPMVYLAFFTLIIGTLYRVIKVVTAKKHLPTLEIFEPDEKPGKCAFFTTYFMPTILKDKPLFWFSLVAYHIAFIILILSHIDLLPAITIMATDSPHMIGYGAVGFILTISLIAFIFRRLRGPVKDISNMGDYLILFILLFVFITGDMISFANSWSENGFVLEKADFRNYLKGLLDFSFENPADAMEGGHFVHIVIHIFFANLFMILFPFTKFTHALFALPLNKIRRSK